MYNRTYFWSLEENVENLAKHACISLQNMHVFPYKTQVQIVVALRALHNYIRRKSIQDVAFNEFDCHLDFVPDNFLTDVVPQSHTCRHQRASCMDNIRDDIATSLMRQ
jgi:hypothetical protein